MSGGQGQGQASDPVTGQVARQVDPWVIQMLTVCARGPVKRLALQEAVEIRHRETFLRNYLDKLLDEKLVERTIPEKPTSRLQKYRLTDKGRALLKRLGGGKV